MKNAVIRFLKDEEGATAIEYGLIAGLIAVAIVVTLTALGENLSDTFDNIAACLGTSTGTCPA